MFTCLSIKYNLPHLTYTEQSALLKNRGLIVNDAELSLTDKEELKAAFGGAMRIKEAYHGLQREIYR